MAKKKLTKRQLSFIDEVFKNRTGYSQALEKLDISNKTYRLWQNNPAFQQEIAYQLNIAQRQGIILITQHCSYAAAKLIQLAGSDKDETARKACLDILQTAQQLTAQPGLIANEDSSDSQAQEIDSQQLKLTDEKAGQLLEILTNHKLEK